MNPRAEFPAIRRAPGLSFRATLFGLRGAPIAAACKWIIGGDAGLFFPFFRMKLPAGGGRVFN